MMAVTVIDHKKAGKPEKIDLCEALRRGLTLESLILQADVEAGSPVLLEKLAGEVEIAQSKEDQVKLVSGKLTDTSWLALVARLDATTREAFRLRLRATRGLASAVDALFKAITRNEPAPERPPEEKPSVAVEQRLKDVFKDLPAEISGTLRVPMRYNLTPYGVLEIDEESEKQRVICPAPLVVTRLYSDTATRSQSVLVGWLTARGWRFEHLPRKTIAVSRSLAEQGSDLGLPVDSSNAADVVAYLSAFLAVNDADFPIVPVTDTMGWKDEGFILGLTWIDRKGTQNADAVNPGRAPLHLNSTHPGTRQFVECWTSAGKYDRWLTQIEKLRNFPTLYLALAASVAPPIMQFLPTARNFILDFCGGNATATSSGKTTTLRVAASVWGRPTDDGSGVINGWNITRPNLEDTAARQTYLPLFLDDTNKVRGLHRDAGAFFTDVIYDLAQGASKSKMGVEGNKIGRKMRQTWRTVVLSTGETPLTSLAKGAAGAAARVLTVWGSPFGVENGAMARLAKETTLELSGNYGFFGHRVIRWLCSPTHQKELQEHYKEAMNYWSDQAGEDKVVHRATDYIALLDTALWVAYECGLPVPDQEQSPLHLAWTAVQRASRDADKPAQALADIYRWCVQRQAAFWGRHEVDSLDRPINPPPHWLGVWNRGELWEWIGIAPDTLKRELERLSYDFEAITSAWKERGWLYCPKAGGRLYPVTYQGSVQAPAFKVRRSAIDGTQQTDN